MGGSVEMGHEKMPPDVGMMMEAQFAIMRPFSSVGLKMAKVSSGLRARKGINLSAITCLALTRRMINVRQDPK